VIRGLFFDGFGPRIGPWVVCSVLLIALATGILWALLPNHGACPKGQHDVYKYSITQTVMEGKVPVIQTTPVYACER